VRKEQFTLIWRTLSEAEVTEEEALQLIAFIVNLATVKEPVFFRGKEIVYDDPNRPGAAPGERRGR
jgi:hypothetical protein